MDGQVYIQVYKLTVVSLTPNAKVPIETQVKFPKLASIKVKQMY